MADDSDLTSPLLSSSSSSSSDHVVVTVHPSAAPPRNPFRVLGTDDDDDDDLSVPPPSTLDPFRNRTPAIEGLYEWAKTVLCLPLAALRLAIFGLCLALGYVATKVALQGWKDKENPMPKWRCRVMWITRLCARCILFSFGYQWIKRKGKPAPREIAPIIVSNHVSYIEPIFYFYELFPTIVAAESHDSIPFVGTIIRAMQVIYVNRFLPSSRKQAVREIKKSAFKELNNREGPLAIDFLEYYYFPREQQQMAGTLSPSNLVHLSLDTQSSLGHVSLGKLMFRMFTQFHNFFEVEYLPVIYPLDDKETAVHFRERTSRDIATALNAVQTGHSYGDIMLHMKAQEAKQENPSSFMVEMTKVESLFHISSMEAVDFLDKFLAMNPDSSGRVQYHDFLRVLRLKACPLSAKIFSFIDVEKSGTITFRQFLYGSAHVMSQPGFHQACEEAFAGCGGAVKAYVVEQELRDFIQPVILNWSEDEVHELFMVFDNDNDGRIDKNDFLSCLRKTPLLIAFFTLQLQQKEFEGNGVIEIV
ncbi:Lysophospholipid acyltransferase LPEAT2 [Glycine max]|uniref:Lysophospholipid acyltransferase LPEAT2 isoform B n=1 Tax=Glycine soja TaxID=3848 RepID=A0A445L630_GLYSO|nr:Lysophospholipid acyltransferase LPEAT2 [Glycine max]RZC18731.1 Lysophospholipid acyltransferase LPEAT2 isoform B [Glycine soja]